MFLTIQRVFLWLWIPLFVSVFQVNAIVRIHVPSIWVHCTLDRSTSGNRTVGETCDRLTQECGAVWTYTNGKSVLIDMICYEEKCVCPHPQRFWVDTINKVCRRRAGVSECDIQSDLACVPNAICVMEEEFYNDMGFILYNTKCHCRSECTTTLEGFCNCDSQADALKNYSAKASAV